MPRDRAALIRSSTVRRRVRSTSACLEAAWLLLGRWGEVACVEKLIHAEYTRVESLKWPPGATGLWESSGSQAGAVTVKRVAVVSRPGLVRTWCETGARVAISPRKRGFSKTTSLNPTLFLRRRW